MSRKHCQKESLQNQSCSTEEHLKACCREGSELLYMPAVERTRSYGFKMQTGELESFGKSFLLPNGSCEISTGRNIQRKDPGRCLWEGLGFGAPALGTRVLGPWWEMHPYEMWAGGRGEPKNVNSGRSCLSLMSPCKIWVEDKKLVFMMKKRS